MTEQTEKIKCVDCEDLFNPDQEGRVTRDGEWLCDSCWCCAEEYMNTLLHYSPDGEQQSLRFDKRLGTVDPEGWEDGDDLPEPIKAVEYIRTDGWRGYDQPILMDGYTVVADGWATGRHGDVPWKHSFNDLIGAMGRGELIPPMDVYVIACLTSNVFSMAIDVVVAEADEDALGIWLATEAQCDLDRLKRALS